MYQFHFKGSVCVCVCLCGNPVSRLRNLGVSRNTVWIPLL